MFGGKDAGWPILIHCQGDAAIDDALDAIEQAYGPDPATGLNRVEHATMARQDQTRADEAARRRAQFPAGPSISIRRGLSRPDLRAERTEFMEPMAACVKAGIRFSLHTDSPVCPGRPAAPGADRRNSPLCDRQIGDRRRPGDLDQ